MGHPQKNMAQIRTRMIEEFKKIKPPMCNGEIEKGEETEARISRMKNHFQIYNYLDELKEKMAIYNLIGKEDI